MKYTEEMILHSDSGYCMPFEAPQGEDVELSLGYGEQTHPETGEQFFHHGIDFPVRYRMLAAVADGIVSGVGSDPVHGICQTIRYGEYEVTYGPPVERLRPVRAARKGGTDGGPERRAAARRRPLQGRGAEPD